MLPRRRRTRSVDAGGRHVRDGQSLRAVPWYCARDVRGFQLYRVRQCIEKIPAAIARCEKTSSCRAWRTDADAGVFSGTRAELDGRAEKDAKHKMVPVFSLVFRLIVAGRIRAKLRARSIIKCGAMPAMGARSTNGRAGPSWSVAELPRKGRVEDPYGGRCWRTAMLRFQGVALPAGFRGWWDRIFPLK